MGVLRKYTFNPDTLLYEYSESPSVYRRLKTALSVIAVVLMVLACYWMYFIVFQFESPKTASLKRENARWQNRMQVLENQLNSYDIALKSIEDRDEGVYRSVFGLPDYEYLSPSLVTRYSYLEESGADQALMSNMVHLDNMVRRAVEESMSLDEVLKVSRKAGDMVSCIPAVPPVSTVPGVFRLSSAFGGRRDPVHGGWRFHHGMDFAAHKGVPVYVTGDGVVESVVYQYYGYGNMIVVDHGFGYKTKYAHLSSMDVAEGMTVHRGDKIAEVGNTGKSTGPHLHYEVIFKGRPVNPYNYMDVKMPADEYVAMIERRISESEYNKKTTTADIISRAGRMQ